MHGDGFGCLHTEDISGHKIEGLPFLRKNTRRCTYAPQDAAVNSKGTRLLGVSVYGPIPRPSRDHDGYLPPVFSSIVLALSLKMVPAGYSKRK